MTQDKVVNLKRMKHLFLLFLKQFEVDEYKLLMQFLQLIINKYNSNPSTLFGFLTNQIEKDEDEYRPHIRKKRLTPSSKNLYLNNRKRSYKYDEIGIDDVNNLKLDTDNANNDSVIEPELDEDNIRFDYNDDDADIDYLDENYNEPLSSGIVKSEFNIEMLKDRTDILDSFIMKTKSTYDGSFEDMDNQEEFEDYEKNSNMNQYAEFQDDVNDEIDENSAAYYENYENHDNDTNEQFYSQEYLDQMYDSKQEDNIHSFSTSQDFGDNEDEFNDDQNHGMYANHISENYEDENYQAQTSYNSKQAKTCSTTQFDSKLRVRKFSDAIRLELERKFTANNFISGIEKTQLAKKLNLTERQVQKWFVHRREKLRRQEKKAGNLVPVSNQYQDSSSQQKQQRTYQSISASSSNKNSGLRKSSALGNVSMLASRQKIDENPYKKFYLTRKTRDTQSDTEKTYEHYGSVKAENYKNDNENACAYENGGNYDNTHDMNNNDHENNDLNYESYNENEDYMLVNSNRCNNSKDEFKENEKDPELNKINEDELNQTDSNLCQLTQLKQQIDCYEKASVNEPPVTKRKCLSVPRRLFPPHVVTHLESLFDTEKYIKENQIEDISRVTNLNEKQIRSWFKQRRFRYNLENKEKGLDQDYSIKQRTNLPKAVAAELEKAFQKNNYVYGNDKKVLSRQLNLKPIQLERWFYYRRKKLASSSINSPENVETFEIN